MTENAHADGRPDVERVLSRLKDFQRDTVEHVFNRMYIDPKPAHRFLVADEVGLGKTMVARGLIARALDHLWDSSSRLDVVYICSNAEIARQNISRLNVFGHSEMAVATRLTLLPTQFGSLRTKRVNFVSFTPGTSFDLKSNMGRSDERVLLHYLLRNAWAFGEKKPPRYLLAGHRNNEMFKREIDWFGTNDAHQLDPQFVTQFIEALEARSTTDRLANKQTLRERFEALLPAFSRSTSNPNNETRKARQALIGELRRVLAATSIRSLEPDLVILDEFQRFSHLLSDNTEDEAALLARELFTYGDVCDRTRVLMLSATPYKMYTLTEDDGDTHYSEFVKTIRFLQEDAQETSRVEQQFRMLRSALLDKQSDTTQIRALRHEVENDLRKIMVRTERLAVSPDRSGMLREVVAAMPHLATQDALAYAAAQRMADALNEPDIMELWKSAPWLISFMDEYQYKKKIKDALDKNPLSGKVADSLRQSMRQTLPVTIPDAAVDAAVTIDVPHPRMRWLLEDTKNNRAWRMLWVPPAHSYYRLEGAFGEAALRVFTKRLVFSAWRVVPKAIAALVSAEAEHGMLQPERRRGEGRDRMLERIGGPLKFGKSAGRLTGMPTLALMYASPTLSALGDPMRLAHEISGPMGSAALADIVDRCRTVVDEALHRALPQRRASGGADEAWYWVAPLLIDLSADSGKSSTWLSRTDLASRWFGRTNEDGGAKKGRNAKGVAGDTAHDRDDDSKWHDHVDLFRQVSSREFLDELGPRPDDLAEVIAELAVAGPANCALRALSRGAPGGSMWTPELRDAAGSIAHGLRGLFNLPEVVPLVRQGLKDPPYWRVVLQYAARGGIQAMLDEYVHVLKESEGLQDTETATSATQIAERMREALGARTSRLHVDQVQVAGNHRVTLERKSMRARFAMRFGADSDEDSATSTRAETVRIAFNSPFWPFVLATTSVGQEGLDFHQYCHAVVHWNIPSNPVDMEQREGRVHRYKGHAVRRNVAQIHAQVIVPEGADPWEIMFAEARAKRSSTSSDLVPYWVYAIENGAAIERHIPNLPLSRDIERYQKLKRMLAVYRMSIGQPRQEELVELLARDLEQTEKVYTDALLDLSPPSARTNR